MRSKIFIRGLSAITLGLMVSATAACAGPTEPQVPQDDSREDPNEGPPGEGMIIELSEDPVVV